MLQPDKKYLLLLDKMFEEYKPIKLQPEYTSYIEKDMLRFLIQLARYKFVAKQLDSDDDVLEIGCGSGLGTIFLSQHCNEVKGIDTIPYMIEGAESINLRQNVSFEVADFFEIDENNKYDVIVAIDVIEHFNQLDGERLIEKTTKLLNPNGILIIGTPSTYSYKYQSDFSKATHIKCYTMEELRSSILKYYGRVLPFSMNDEIVHTGDYRMAWYYFTIAIYNNKDI